MDSSTLKAEKNSILGNHSTAVRVAELPVGLLNDSSTGEGFVGWLHPSHICCWASHDPKRCYLLLVPLRYLAVHGTFTIAVKWFGLSPISKTKEEMQMAWSSILSGFRSFALGGINLSMLENKRTPCDIIPRFLSSSFCNMIISRLRTFIKKILEKQV